jgi:hypothetical protein
MATVALSGIITPTNVVTATSTTTLTNKTLTAPTIASANLTTALTLAGAAGTNGQVLTSAGSGLPTWANPSAGAMTFISVTTVSGTPSTLDITSGISSTYDDYIVIFENAALSANAAKLQMLLYKSGAYQENTYQDLIIAIDAGSTSPVGAGDSVCFTISKQAASTNANLRSGTIYLYNLNSTTAYASGCTWSSQNTGTSGTGTNNLITTGGGTEATAAAVTRLRFRPSTGTFTSGTFRLYGIQKS